MYKRKDHKAKNIRFYYKGNYISTNTNEETEARQFIDNFNFEVQKPFVNSVADALDAWAKNMDYENRFTCNHYSVLKKVRPWFGQFNVSQVPHMAVEEYYKERTRTVKNTTAEKELRVLKGAINHCYKKKYIDNPSNIMIEGSPVNARQRYFTDEEVKLILNAPECQAKPWGKLLLKIAFATCARKTAIRTLRVEQLKFHSNLIDFNSKDMKKKAKPRAIVPFANESLKQELLEASERSKTGHILETPTGVMTEYECDSFWKKVYKQIGINKDPNIENAVFHTIRHTGAVKMVKSGKVSMKEISVYLGHKSVNVTERVYAKYSPNFMKESANVMGDFIS